MRLLPPSIAARHRSSGRPARIALATLFCALVVLTASSGPQASVSFASQLGVSPSDFVSEPVVQNIPQPTDFAFAPDGRLFVATLAGDVLIVKDGALLPEPFISIPVNHFYERGLLGLALDPSFETEPYVYLYYTFENNPENLKGLKTGRLIRVTAEGDAALPGSEVVLLGTDVGGPFLPACGHLAVGADCIPADGPSHLGGALRFAPDGSLCLATGDAAFGTVNADELMPRAQDLNSLAGKLLRLDTDGNGLPDNPFYTGDPTDNRSKIWAYGLRQPFRMGIHPKTGLPYVGDVGSQYWDEIDVAAAGLNFGWPCYEGESPHPENSELAFCQDFYASEIAITQPLYSYSVPPGAAIIAGVFYEGSSYPTELDGAFFFGDWARKSISVLNVDDEGRLASDEATELLSDAGAPIDLEIGPDGDVYYLAFEGGGDRESLTGEIRHIRFLDEGSTFWSGRRILIFAGAAVAVLAMGGAASLSRRRWLASW